jgi:hypothetical protein
MVILFFCILYWVILQDKSTCHNIVKGFSYYMQNIALQSPKLEKDNFSSCNLTTSFKSKPLRFKMQHKSVPARRKADVMHGQRRRSTGAYLTIGMGRQRWRRTHHCTIDVALRTPVTHTWALQWSHRIIGRRKAWPPPSSPARALTSGEEIGGGSGRDLHLSQFSHHMWLN